MGLCHISELPGTNSEDIRTKYIVGDTASAKILKVKLLLLLLGSVPLMLICLRPGFDLFLLPGELYLSHSCLISVNPLSGGR